MMAANKLGLLALLLVFASVLGASHAICPRIECPPLYRGATITCDGILYKPRCNCIFGCSTVPEGCILTLASGKVPFSRTQATEHANARTSNAQWSMLELPSTVAAASIYHHATAYLGAARLLQDATSSWQTVQ
ncbi:hypothetical protein AKJ16_DCAP17688 [Drosera capensis]